MRNININITADVNTYLNENIKALEVQRREHFKNTATRSYIDGKLDAYKDLQEYILNTSTQLN